MKYTGRILTISSLIISSAAFKINVYLSLGYLPPREWILTAIFMFPVWWIGLQVDKARYYAKEMKKKEEEKVELFESVDAVIYSYDLKNNNLMISSKVSELCGYSADEFINNKDLWKKIIYKEDIDIVGKFKQKILKGETGIGEYRIQLPNGELKWIQKRIKPILDSNGKVIKLNGVDIDIDQRKKVEELLSYS
jgi:PAS domain S-box-containing protein